MDSDASMIGSVFLFKIKIIKYQSAIFSPVRDILDIPYYELIKVEATVRIYINHVMFFSDDYFPILEFIYQFEQWRKNPIVSKFEYNSIETDENPIVSFQIQNDNCIFDSVWKLTSEISSVKLPEVLNEINDCKINLLKMLNSGK